MFELTAFFEPRSGTFQNILQFFSGAFVQVSTGASAAVWLLKIQNYWSFTTVKVINANGEDGFSASI